MYDAGEAMMDENARRAGERSARTYLDAYLKSLAHLLDDPATVELAVNGDGSVWIERIGDPYMTQAHDAGHANVQQLCQSIAAAARQPIGDRHPLLSAKMPYKGEAVRAQVVAPPALEGGGAISLRKYVSRDFAVNDFAFLDGAAKDADAERRDLLAEVSNAARSGDHVKALNICVAEKLNILISGGTSTAKTSLARAMMREFDPAERVVTIEDAIELLPPSPNKVMMIAERDPASPRSAEKLLAASLRMRPDRIIVGELRGVEAFTFMEAINTGHGGSISTIHAETPRLAIERMAMMVVGQGVAMPYEAIRKYVQTTIDVIVQLGRRDGRRGLVDIHLPGLDGPEGVQC